MHTVGIIYILDKRNRAEDWRSTDIFHILIYNYNTTHTDSLLLSLFVSLFTYVPFSIRKKEREKYMKIN